MLSTASRSRKKEHFNCRGDERQEQVGHVGGGSKDEGRPCQGSQLFGTSPPPARPRPQEGKPIKHADYVLKHTLLRTTRPKAAGEG